MNDYHFLSYSSADAYDFAIRLTDALGAGPPPIRVWLDKRELQAGIDWDIQVREAIRGCKTLLFVMRTASVDVLSVAKEEWIYALRYTKPVITLHFARVDLPFLLGNRENRNCQVGKFIHWDRVSMPIRSQTF